MSKTIGVLGGMGPEATAHLFNLIVKFTRADSDQGHIPIIIFNNPKIPDRSAGILHGGPSPLPALIEGAKFLEKAGADIIVIPCHTAHHFYNEICNHIHIPILHLQHETRLYVEKKNTNIKRFGLISTVATIKMDLFQSIFNESKEGLKIVVPDDSEQELMMEAMYGKKGIKRGFKKEPRALLLKVIAHLKEKKAEAIIAGCTETSLVLKKSELQLPVIDPLKIIAKAAILKAGYEVKE
ncbi:MAG: amino acid racemase [Acidobacteria bacterium]|jgi:aspartate racemase|nr:amino acid racemase [Acidobacteriota bacterium]